MIITDRNELHFLAKANFIFNDVFKTVKEETAAKLWLAGGSLSSLCTKRMVHDYDIFSNDPEAIVTYLKKFVHKQNNSSSKIFENDQVCNAYHNGIKIQVIKQYPFNTAQQLVEYFDFTVCAAAYDGQSFYAHDRFFIDNAQRRLVINNLPHPLATFRRTYKYASYGYEMCPIAMNTILKTVTAMNIDFDNPLDNPIMFYPDGGLRFTGVD